MQGILILKLLGKKHHILERQSTSSAAEGLSRTQETDPTILLSLLSGPPLASVTLSVLLLPKCWHSRAVSEAWHEAERSCKTKALWFCTDVPCLGFLTFHYSFELPFLQSWLCLYVCRAVEEFFFPPSRIVCCSSGCFHFFFSASPFSASHFLCLFAGIWHCLEKD